MQALRSMIAVAAVLVLLIAQPISGQCSGGIRLTTPEEARDLAANCLIYNGDIELASGIGAINLTGISRIYGNLEAMFAEGITEIVSSTLRMIGGTLFIRNSTTFDRIIFDLLEDVGRIRFEDLPNFRLFQPNVGRAGGWAMLQNVSSVDIRRTGLPDIDWLFATGTRLVLYDNHNISALGPDLMIWADAIDIKSNHPDFSISFGALRWAQNISIAGASTISMPRLALANDTFLLANSSLTELELPQLDNITESLILVNNSALEVVRLPMLARVGENIILDRNDALEAVNFQALEHVERNIEANGSFTKLNFPALVDVHGDVFVSSTAALDCGAIDEYNKANIFKARYSCTAKADPQILDPEEGEGRQSQAGGGLSAGAKAGIGVSAVLSVALLAVGVYFLWRISKLARDEGSSSKRGATENWRKSELPTETKSPGMAAVGRHEVSGTSRSRAGELDASSARHELPT